MGLQGLPWGWRVLSEVRNIVVGVGVKSPAVNCHFDEKYEKKYLVRHVPFVVMLS